MHEHIGRAWASRRPTLQPWRHRRTPTRRHRPVGPLRLVDLAATRHLV